MTISMTEHTDTNKISQTRCANGNANDCKSLYFFFTWISCLVFVQVDHRRAEVWLRPPQEVPAAVAAKVRPRVHMLRVQWRSLSCWPLYWVFCLFTDLLDIKYEAFDVLTSSLYLKRVTRFLVHEALKYTVLNLEYNITRTIPYKSTSEQLQGSNTTQRSEYRP